MVEINAVTITAIFLIFLSGVGIGAAITEMIEDKETEDEKAKNDNTATSG